MAVKIRLQRFGKTKAPFYRLVVMDSRNPRDGRALETIGTYDVIKVPAEIKVNEELAMKWLNNGAIPTDTAKNILSKAGVMKKFHESKVKPSSKPKAEKVTKEVKKTTTKKAKAE